MCKRISDLKKEGSMSVGNKILGAVLIAFCFAVGGGEGKCRAVTPTTMSCRDATADDLPKSGNEKVEWIVFTKSHVSLLKKEHLESFPSLTDLHAEGNEIEKIEEDAFATSKNLDWVDVSFNKLTSIHPDIFKNSPKVYFFNISGNSNFHIPEKAPFINAPELQWLIMQQMNIKTVYSETFQNVPGLKVLSLSGNELTTLPRDVFQPLKKLYSLDLTKNKFTQLPVTVFQHLGHISLYMEDNPWECDCSLYPTIEWAKNRRLRDEARCSKPDNKKWKDVLDLKCSNLVEVF